MEGKDTSKSKGKSPLSQAEAQPQRNETNGGVFLVKQEAVQAISEKSKGKSPLPQAEAQSQSIEKRNETNGEVFHVKQETVQAISEKSKEQTPPPQAQGMETNVGVLLVKEEAAAQAISESTEKKPAPQSNGAKKRGKLNLLRVALFMLRHRSRKKSKSIQAEVASKGLWRRILGSMRPLHLQDSKPQSAPAPASGPVGLPPSVSIENFHEMMSSPMSPQRPYSPSSSPASSSSQYSSVDSQSRYASTQSLQELGRRAGCNFDDEIEEEELLIGEDEMIDAKAEEFIANFYKQMRLQRLDSIKCYNEMIERGLG